MLNHQPEPFDLDKPKAQRNADGMRGSLFFSRVASTDVPSEQIKAAIDAEMAKVQKYIDYQALQIDPFNASLRDEASTIVHRRRDRLLKARDVAASLGYPPCQRNGERAYSLADSTSMALAQMRGSTICGTPSPASGQGALQIQDMRSVHIS